MTVGDLVKSVTRLFEGGAIDAPAQPRYPEMAIEITPDRVLGVRVAPEGKNGHLVLQRAVSEPLPEGAIEPSLTRPNVLAPEPVSNAIGSVLSRIAEGGHRVSLLIPDQIARVAILGFATLPRTRRELIDLVRFRMAKSLPFKADQAVLDLNVLRRGGGAGPAPSSASVLAAFIHRPVLEQYEDLLARRGYWPGLVALSSLELFNLHRDQIGQVPAGDKDVLLMNITRHDLTLLIFRGEDLIFYRCKPHPAGASGEETIASLRREVYTSFAFYQEKLLGRGLGRAFVRTIGLPLEAVQDVVAGEAGCPLETLDLPGGLKVAEGVGLGPRGAADIVPAVGAVAGRRS